MAKAAPEIADRVGAELAAPRPFELQLERLGRVIGEAERQVEAQEALVAQAEGEGRDAALEDFELRKMQLMVAILREGRERLLGTSG
jgi:hypothetical protein